MTDLETVKAIQPYNLTNAQRRFLWSICEEGLEGLALAAECDPKEWRTAKSLEARGLVQVIGDRGRKGHFAVTVPKGEARFVVNAIGHHWAHRKPRKPEGQTP